MRRRLIKGTLLLLPIPLLVAGVNFFVDPAHLFDGSTYERRLALLLLDGNSVANVGNYDERLVQKFYIEGLQTDNETIVLGSSRSMHIGSEILSEGTLFNHAVSGASLEDLMAIYNIYRREGRIPRRVILGLDPWMLNASSGQTRWKSLRADFESIAGIASGVTSADRTMVRNPGNYKQLLSPRYFQASIKSIVGMGGFKATGEDFYVTTEEEPEDGMLREDGCRTYPASLRDVTTKEVLEKAREYVSKDPVYALSDFRSLDEGLSRHLARFLDILREDGVEVILFLPPYHPLVYDYLSSSGDYGAVGKTERYIRELAEDHGILVVGSYDPERLGLKAHQFYDGMHPRAEAILPIFDGAPD